MIGKSPIPVVRFDQWPVRDRIAWEAAIRAGDPFDGAGPLARYSDDRRTKLMAAFGRWLGYLASARPGALAETGLDHLDRDALEGFIGQLSATLAPCSVRGYLTDLLTVAKALGKGPYELLHAAVVNSWRTARPMHDKRQRLVPSQELLACGVGLMENADEARTSLKAAAAFRDGLLIAVLAARPLRLSNLASIAIGRHLERHGTVYWLAFPAKEVKNRRPLEFPLPAALTEGMDEYLNERRPFLLARHGRWKDEAAEALWISEHGSALKRGQIKDIIPRRTRARFGRAVNAHLFRDAAATSIASGDPEHVGIIMAILGHTSHATGERFYNQATTLQASRRFQAVLDQYQA